MLRPERIPPGPGQESVWDYPRPPAIDPSPSHVLVCAHGVTLADTTRAIRVLETSQAPAFYLPPDDIVWEHFIETAGRSFCEWKGSASYLEIVVDGQRIPDAAWRYRTPVARFEVIRDHVAFYPQKVDCFVDGEQARAMPGGFYGGWITDRIVGPFKGAPGTMSW